MIQSALSVIVTCVVALATLSAQAQSVAGSKPNILLIVGDDVGYGDLGPYLGGESPGNADPQLRSAR